MEKIPLLNTEVLSITESQLLEKLKAELQDDKKCGNGVIITPNVDHLVKLQKDKEFYKCYCEAEYLICDSKILYLCSKLLKKSFPEAIPGSSFFTHFYEYNKSNEYCRIFLLGGMDGVADQARKRINEKMGREIVVGSFSPSFGFEKKQNENELIYKMIEASKANVVLVGVGAPKQEKWIFAHKDRMCNVKIWMALGATIDFEAGNIKRAPKIFQKLALEWLYRMWCEPKRMFKRYICDDLAFFIYFFKQLCGVYKNPWV